MPEDGPHGERANSVPKSAECMVHFIGHFMPSFTWVACNDRACFVDIHHDHLLRLLFRLLGSAVYVGYQLELFETVMNDDDEKHAKPTDESGVRGWVRVEPKPDPPAVASMRLVVGKLGANSETGVIVEVMAATMRRMADAHCSLAQWKRLK